MSIRVQSCVLGFVLGVCLFILVHAAPAFAAPGECTTGTPWWHLNSSIRPASVSPGGEATLVVEATNVGDGCTSSAITLHDTLPAGVTVVEKSGAPVVTFYAFYSLRGQTDLKSLCHVGGNVVTCTLPDEPPLFPAQRPFEDIEMRIAVKVGLQAERNETEVTGGGAAPLRATQNTPVSKAKPAFGVERYEMVPEEEGGATDAQAGSHPFQLTTTFNFNQTEEEHLQSGGDYVSPPAQPRNLQFQLPAGFVGNATSLPQCSDLDFTEIQSAQDYCPGDSVVGVASVTFDEPKYGLRTAPVPLFNLVPEYGEPARFGFIVLKTPVVLDTSVRTGTDYGVTVHVSNVSQVVNFIATNVTFWGVPGDSRHDNARGWACLATAIYETNGESCVKTNQTSPAPFLTLPTSCETPFATRVQGESWPVAPSPGAPPTSIPLPPAEYSLQDSFGRQLKMAGCNQLPFDPRIEVVPDVTEASASAGMKVDIHLPQEVNENALGLASSSVKSIEVTLPQGVSVNPSGSNGLASCAESQVGFKPSSTGAMEFSPSLPEDFCAASAKVATVKIESPLIADPLEGAVYIASQNENPFGSLLAMYLVAQDPVSGILVKLAGEVRLSNTGQITTTFDGIPQVPFDDSELHFFGGERAPLATPEHCGAYRTTTAIVPWSAEASDLEGATKHPSSTFNVDAGPHGSPCPGSSLPFAPSLTGGTTNIVGGAFSPLTTAVGREDGDQDLQTVTLHLPSGLSGLLSSVQLCPEQQANEGTCGAGSEIAETTVSAGVGSDPVTVTGGRVYLTEKYAGAPFGLSIVTPVKAGPFDLEHDTSNPAQQPPCDCFVVRAKIDVDPYTTALTVTTDSSGPHSIPRLIDGVPVHLKSFSVTTNRTNFTFNPTNCGAMSMSGSITGYEGASSSISVPFQVANCAVLKFAPKFSVSTSGKTSKAAGASLTTKLVYPNEPMGTEANISRVKVDLPIQLPSRLSTLQKACTDAQFELNPADCPTESKVGYAVVHTPVLPVPLEGPAIFVSHGGEAFPSLTIVLQGDNVTVNLVGETFISKAGVTSTTFKTVPDQPFSSFELKLPEGKYSALAAPTGVCSLTRTVTVSKRVVVTVHGSKRTVTRKVKLKRPSSLEMPTEFMAQNGAVVHQSTPISVTGCVKKPAAKVRSRHRPKK